MFEARQLDYSILAPDAVQHEVMHSSAGAHHPATTQVPSPRRTAEEALRRVRDTEQLQRLDLHLAELDHASTVLQGERAAGML